MSTSDPFTNPTAWDTMTIGGVRTPGRCEVDAKRPYKWDIRRGMGADGAFVVFVGTYPAEPKITFYLWAPEHFAAWDALRPALKYNLSKGRPVFAIDVYHPALAAIDISKIVVTEVGAIKHQGGSMYSFEVSFLEYRPIPKDKAVGAPTQSKDIADPVDPAIVARQNQVAGLARQAAAAYAP